MILQFINFSFSNNINFFFNNSSTIIRLYHIWCQFDLLYEVVDVTEWSKL